MKRHQRLLSSILVFIFLVSNVFLQNGIVASAYAPQKGRDKLEILVKYKDDTKSETVNTKVKTKLKMGKLKRTHKMKRSKIEVLEIGNADNLNKTITELQKDPNVLYAQPNYLMSVEEDPRYNEQWALKNTEQQIGYITGTEGVDLNAEEAWTVTSGAPTVVVGVLDTGIDVNHKDLKNNIYMNVAEIPNNGIDDDGNGYIDDCQGWDFFNGDNTVFDSATEDKHGTHVAGIIAAESNDEGIKGLAPNVKLLPLKFVSGGKGYTSDAIEAFEYAQKLGCKVINCSFGSKENNPALKDAMDKSDILFVCSAGNDAQDNSVIPEYPASFGLPNVISVAAVDNKGELAEFSNFGDKVDIAAPGVGILSTVPENNYDFMSGTSFSAPYISAIAALLRSYIPDMTPAQLKTRIKKNVTEMDGLKNQVATGGIPDAYAALTDPTATTGPTNTNTTTTTGTTTKGGKTGVVTTLAVAISQQLMEQIHFGENGVSPTTGNYSKTITDLSINAPGFKIDISRTYNAKDDKASGFMGRGWTFGFEGNIKPDTTNASLMVAKLPNGSVQVFAKNGDVYTANDSRSTLVKNGDNSYLLTTKDQYTYKFNSDGYLTVMTDKNGNTVTISLGAGGRVTKIRDQVGREFNVIYTAGNLISKITSPLNGIEVSYTYNASNVLETVTDPTGSKDTYVYDTSNRITTIKDNSGNVSESLVYYSTSDGNNNKVRTYKDILGCNSTYTYDTANRVTTISNQDAGGATVRTIKKTYDTSLYVTKSTDPEGKDTVIEYFLDGNGVNTFGEEKAITDRNGNKTVYERDGKGNITKATNPDGTTQECRYDGKNNTIAEKDEAGNWTYYVYDANGVNLLKKAQPLNSADIYSDTADQSKFSVTRYEYYTNEDAQAMGCNVIGLQRKEISPAGELKTFTYDKFGNVATVVDGENNTTINSYNELGWLLSTTTPEGYRTDFIYDNQGRLLQRTLNGGETTRIEYDEEGRKEQEISPKEYDFQYDKIGDKANFNPYSDEKVGYRYAYYATGSYGKLKSLTDPAGNVTSYTYDIFGNTTSETKPNGSVYVYTYDTMNRITGTSFKDNSGAAEVVLEKYAYTVNDGKTTKTVNRWLEGKVYSTTTVTYDYADREIGRLNPDSGREVTKYNGNGTVNCKIDANGGSTYYRYDGLNRLTETWTQVTPGGYSYTQTVYDKSGKKLQERSGKDLIELHGKAADDRAVTKTYTYYPSGRVKTVTDSAGAKTTYEYDKDGNVIRQNEYVSKDESNVTEYEYNHLGKPITKRVFVRNGDLSGKSFEDGEKTALVTTLAYDKNGNAVKMVTPDGNKTITEYDNLNREISVSQLAQDEKGLPTIRKESKTYDSMGNVKSETDPLGNVSTYTYNQQNLLVKAVKKSLTSAFDYDRLGRKTVEVSPNNYDDKIPSLTAMNHTAYTYDNMDHVITKRENFKDTTGKAVSFISKAFKYDLNGNMVKELDGEGFNTGFGNSDAEKINSGYGTQYQYNMANKVVNILDPASRERELSYSIKYEYDGLMRKIAEINGKGAITGYYYDDGDNVTSVTIRASAGDPEKVVKSATYDLLGNPLTQTDGNGNVTTLEYNAFGKVRKALYPTDETVPASWKTVQYDVMGNALKSEDSEGVLDLYTYDLQGRALSHTEKLKEATDSSSNTAVNTGNATTGAGTDSLNNALGKNTTITTSVTYDLNGNKRFEVDGNGNKKENIYDALNRLIEVKIDVTNTKGVKTSHSTKFEYDKNGNATKNIDWRGNVSENVYDAINRLVEKRDPNYGVSQKPIQKLEYNASHVQVKSTDGKGNVTTFSYDRNNRLVETKDPMGHSVRQSYDDAGNLDSKTDGNGNKTYFEYDSMNRLICVTNSLKEETKYTYDMNGNTLTQTDGNGNVMTMEYNVLNKQSRRIDMGGRTGADGKYTYDPSKTESYTYDAEGHLLTKKDRNEVITSYTYDIHGRMLSQEAGVSNLQTAIDTSLQTAVGSTSQSSGLQKITYTYDNNGNQLSMFDATGTTNRTYDEMNRVTGKSITKIGTTTFQYDLIEGLTDGYTGESSTDPKGNTTTKIYDKVGRMKAVKADGEATGTVYEYDNNGNRTSVTYDSGAKEAYSFNADNQLETLTNTKPGAGALDSYSYTYDAAHNQTQKTDSKGVTTYQYDSLNRLNYVLEPASLSGKLTQYTYDKAGNRQTETVTLPATGNQPKQVNVTEYKYNEQNRLMTTEVATDAGAKSVTKYVYDNNGNMTAKSMETTKPFDPNVKPSFGMFVIGQDTSNLRPEIQAIAKSMAVYEYDRFNQLVVAKTSGGTAEYKYNGDGLRVEKALNNTTTKYLYEYDKVVLELDGNNKEIGRNVYGTNLISKKVDGQKLFYMYNGHADVTSLIDGSGAVQATYYYDAFGNVKEQTGNVKNSITYAGYQYDKETGLYYLNSRMYDPVTARFMQEDTYRGQANDPLSLNLYTYCDNSPVLYSDPTGHAKALDDPGDKKVAPGQTKTSTIKTKTGTTTSTTSTSKSGVTTTKVVTKTNTGATTTSTKVSTSGKTSSLKVVSTPAPKTPAPTSTGTKSTTVVTQNNKTAITNPGMQVRSGYNQLPEYTVEVQKQNTSTAVSMIPGVGDVKDAFEAYSGKDYITGERLSPMERVTSGLCAVVPVVSGSLIRTGGKIAGDAAENIAENIATNVAKDANKGVTASKNVFPSNPKEFLNDVPSTTTPRGNIKWEPNSNTRVQYHPGDEVKVGETYNPRHHDPHYHVEIRQDPSKGWNNPGNVNKMTPDGYTKGSGTGFLPGEKLPVK